MRPTSRRRISPTRFRDAPYDGEIASVDRELARVLKAIEQREELDKTVVLVTADHGESLGEHGEGAHGLFLYDATIHVPWIMAGPGIASGRVSPTIARLIDVLPTLHDYAGLPRSHGLEGRSLRPAAEGRRMDDAPSYAESLYSELELGWAPLYSWRAGGFKLIEAPRPELYDLKNDPAELTNLVERDPARVAAVAPWPRGVAPPVVGTCGRHGVLRSADAGAIAIARLPGRLGQQGAGRRAASRSQGRRPLPASFESRHVGATLRARGCDSRAHLGAGGGSRAPHGAAHARRRLRRRRQTRSRDRGHAGAGNAPAS